MAADGAGAIIFIVTWLVGCALVQRYAMYKGRSHTTFFWLSILFSPALMFVVAVCCRSNDELVRAGYARRGYEKCAYCAEPVRSEAIKCRHCGSSLAKTRAEVDVLTKDDLLDMVNKQVAT